MNAEQCYIDDIFLLMQRIELSTSLERNEELSLMFWKTFNQQLKEKHLTQGKTFLKYAVTFREQQHLYYGCGVIPKGTYPIGFTLYHIPRGHYLKFIHKGSHKTIKDTIRSIFEDYIPTHDVSRLSDSIQYYERYDEQFHFDREDSIVEIYVPIQYQEESKFPCIPAKSLIQGGGFIQNGYAKFSWFGMDYNMNLYKGCCHGCIYCDSRSSCYQVEYFDVVRGKENEIVLLEQELRRKRRKGTIGIGAMSDTYNPFEKTQCITRQALELIKRYGYGIGIDTKSTLILRDIDLIAQIAKQYPSIIKITITCADDETSKIIEPYAPVSSERFALFDAFHNQGIFAGILLMPILPFINDTEENIRKIVQLAYKHHAKFIYPAFGVTLRDNQRDYFYYQLDRYFPGKRQLYEQRYHNTYSCDSIHAARLYKIFKKECVKYGILYRMSDIIHAYKKVVPNEQMSWDL